MNLEPIRFRSPISTAQQLDFPDEDKVIYPWLAQDIRYYSLDRPLNEGAFAIPYVGYPCDRHGTRLPNSPAIVVKIPKVDLFHYSKANNERRLDYIRKQARKEITHIRRRLTGCNHANPILDVVPLPSDDFDLPATVQLFLENAVELDTWLLRQGLRECAAVRGVDGLVGETWSGIASRRAWIDTCTSIAEATRDLHQRRVTHGDLHPGNVFLNLGETPFVRLIDFGEAFVATPDLNSRTRRGRSYLAPERIGPRYPLSEQVDIYSFGMLLLYLATGTERPLTTERRSRTHRSYLSKLIGERNPALIKDEPRILDLVGRATARDPADRPRMSDICDDLRGLANDTTGTAISTRTPAESTLRRLADAITDEGRAHNPVLMSLVERQIRELERTFDALQTEMVEFYGTRDQSLRVLIALFEHLKSGDSWTTATTLAMWQGGALGRNGSYASANIRALKRGVGIRRVFIVAVAEIGRDFSAALESQLSHSSVPSLRRLGHSLHHAIAQFDKRTSDDGYIGPTPAFVETHRGFLVSVMDTLADMITRWSLPMAAAGPVDIERSPGFLIGITFVGTMDEIGAVREDNPASLMHFASEPDETRRWLLVVSEMRGRVETMDGQTTPHLLGLRVYRTVQRHATPTDRILGLEQLINKDGVNVSPGIAELSRVVQAINDEM